MGFSARREHGLLYFTSTQLSGVRHAFSTRKGGVSAPPWDGLNLGPGRGDRPEAVRENYHVFFGALGLDETRAVLAKQVHETTVRTVTAADAGKGLFRERDFTADALITNVASLPLVVFSADCGIILLHDPVTGAVGAVHAGWRGCAGGIPEKAVRQMERQFGADHTSLRAAIGPCIGVCCFETDRDVPEAMRRAMGSAAEPYLRKPAAPGGKWHVDLAGLNQLWLINAGVPANNIDVCALCTACRPDLFWSHRKMGERRGVQTAVIAAGSLERESTA